MKKHLIKEQRYLCAYCCSEIDAANSHNEHIEPQHPKSGTSKKSLDYNNLVVSCYGYAGEKTCGPKKGNEYDEEKFVSPLSPECENIFSYFPNGYICGDEYTINLLNLNSYRLRQARQAVYKIVMNMNKEDIELIYCDEENDKLQPYFNVIKWYLNQESIHNI